MARVYLDEYRFYVRSTDLIIDGYFPIYAVKNLDMSWRSIHINFDLVALQDCNTGAFNSPDKYTDDERIAIMEICYFMDESVTEALHECGYDLLDSDSLPDWIKNR